jgi:hypothetical protein
MSVKLCPVPMTFTCSPRSMAPRTMATISSSVVGDSIRVGLQL